MNGIVRNCLAERSDLRFFSETLAEFRLGKACILGVFIHNFPYEYPE